MQQAELLEVKLGLLNKHLSPLLRQVCFVAHNVEERSICLPHSRCDFG